MMTWTAPQPYLGKLLERLPRFSLSRETENLHKPLASVSKQGNKGGFSFKEGNRGGAEPIRDVRGHERQ